MGEVKLKIVVGVWAGGCLVAVALLVTINRDSRVVDIYYRCCSPRSGVTLLLLKGPYKKHQQINDPTPKFVSASASSCYYYIQLWEGDAVAPC